MHAIRTIIVDDEGLARDTLQLLLAKHKEIEIIATCENGKDAIDTIQKLQPDLVFLDIQMPEANGFDVIAEVGPEKMPVVIFATAYDQYALRAFQAAALDYLLKPFDDERFEQALERAILQVRQQKSSELGAKLVNLIGAEKAQSFKTEPGPETASPTDTFLERIMVKERGSIFFIKVADIVWIEAAGDYISIHTTEKNHLIRETMAGLLAGLNPRTFVRIHRSSIVNVEQIKELKPYFHGDYIVILKNGKELKLSRRYWEGVEKVLGR